jgi:hypothetical protein
MKIKPFTCFLCAVALILIGLSPWLIQSYYFVQPEDIPYKGILTLWNITGWRTGGSSCSAFLKKRITEFESRNAYMFIDMTDMTAEEAAEALQKGDAPDIISYPLGFSPDLPLSPLPHKSTIFPEIQGDTYPYMCGAYLMLINADMLDENGLFPPDGWGVRPAELLAMAQLGVCFDSEEGFSSLPVIAAHEYPVPEGPGTDAPGSQTMPDAALGLSAVSYSGGIEYFCSGQAGILIASQRQHFEVNKKFEEGSAPAFLTYAVSGYTDMVQLISVVPADDAKKQKACTDFAEYLLEERAQSKLEALGVFPVLPGLKIYQDNECYNSAYRLLADNALLAMPGDRQRLAELSMEMLGGSKDALTELRRLLNN